MSVPSSQVHVAAMQSAITSRERTDVSVLMDTSLQQMGGLVLVSFTLKSTVHWLLVVACLTETDDGFWGHAGF